MDGKGNVNITIGSSSKNNLISYINNGQTVFITFDTSNNIPEISDVLIIDQIDSNEVNKIITGNFCFALYGSEENTIGHIQKKIWKPGLTNNFEKILEFTQFEKNIAKRDLADIIGNLQEILHYIEPSTEGLK